MSRRRKAPVQALSHTPQSDAGFPLPPCVHSVRSYAGCGNFLLTPRFRARGGELLPPWCAGPESQRKAQLPGLLTPALSRAARRWLGSHPVEIYVKIALFIFLLCVFSFEHQLRLHTKNRNPPSQPCKILKSISVDRKFDTVIIYKF